VVPGSGGRPRWRSIEVDGQPGERSRSRALAEASTPNANERGSLVPFDNTTRPLGYPMPTQPLNIDPDYLAGVLSARRELGPDAEAAVIAVFLERTAYAIDARVDQRIAQHRAAEPQARRRGSGGRAWLAIASMVLAIPITGIATEFGGLAGVAVALIAWIGIILVNVTFAFGRP
jgi:hypothetical protein